MQPKYETVVILMGTTGSGKSTIGEKLQEKHSSPDFKIKFVDGDTYHPKSNKDKMAGGTPLTDEDREPWLLALRSLYDPSTPNPLPQDDNTNAQSQSQSGDDDDDDEATRSTTLVIACSALKRKYRDLLCGKIDSLKDAESASASASASASSATSDRHQQQQQQQQQPHVVFAYLKASEKLITDRVQSRSDHFMKANMVHSQFATLEEPTEEEARQSPDGGDRGLIVVEIREQGQSPDDVANELYEKLVQWKKQHKQQYQKTAK